MLPRWRSVEDAPTFGNEQAIGDPQPAGLVGPVIRNTVQPGRSHLWWLRVREKADEARELGRQL
jgi:hypothetical protein